MPTFKKQVCVEPPPSALDLTLPAFAAERRRRDVQNNAGAAAIDRCLPPVGRSAANPPAAVAAVGRYYLASVAVAVDSGHVIRFVE